MPLSVAELLTLLDRARSAAESPGQPAEQAASLAAAVRSAWPAAAACACQLDGPAGTAVAAYDRAGRAAPDLADALSEPLAGPAGDADGGSVRVWVAPLEGGGRRHGGLAAAVSADDGPALAAAARVAGQALDRAALADELADRDWLADLGEVVGPVTHEFNNFLNTLMLQVAVMEMTAPDALKAELQGVKRQGKQIAAVIRQLQQYRRRRAGDVPPADLSRAAAAAADSLERAPGGPSSGPRVRRAGTPAAAGDVPLRLDLADGLPLVSGPAADLRRLCRFLVGGAAWAVAGRGSLALATAPARDGATLRVEAAGTTDRALARLLEGPIGADGAFGLELAACQSLVRRLGGAVRAEPVPGGEALVVDLPAAGA